MPRANPAASFEVAARHLFRYVHDPLRLRDNPLTARFFEPASSAIGSRAADRVALDRIHAVIRTTATRIRDDDVAAGRREHAERQYAIVVDGCLGGKPNATIASALGISTTQFYRERAEICTRIARSLRDSLGREPTTSVTPFDDFQYAIARAATLAEIGNAARAIDEFDRLFLCAGFTSQKIQALCEQTLVYLRSDRFDEADRCVRIARKLLDNSTGLTARERGFAGAHIAYVRGVATWPKDPSAALELYMDALPSLERLSPAAADPARELYARVTFEYGESLGTFHRLSDGVRTLAHAATIYDSCQNGATSIALRIQIALRTFRSSLLTDPLGWEPLRDRLQTMLELGRRARSTGSTDLNLRALNAIAQFEASAGNAPAALGAARSALALSKFEPTQEVFSEVSLRMARTIMYTPLWHEVPGLLIAAGPPATAAVAASRKILEAEFALRRGMYETVRQTIGPSEIAKRPFMAVLAAQAAHGLGRQREARRLIESAVPAVEQSGVAITIERTYRIAEQITNDRSYRRKADEIERALSA
jgi:tetratricopeptide (TPR) repeat protein